LEYSDSNNNKQISNKKEKANSRERERERDVRETNNGYILVYCFISEDSDSLGNTRIFVFGWISIRIVYLVCTQIQLFS